MTHRTWTEHLTSYRSRHTNLTLKECMKQASKTYRAKNQPSTQSKRRHKFPGPAFRGSADIERMMQQMQQRIYMTEFAVAVQKESLEVYRLIKDIKNKNNFLGIAHDTGAAIKGLSRIDLFTGFGQEAEMLAAELNNKISINKLESKTK